MPQREIGVVFGILGLVALTLSGCGSSDDKKTPPPLGGFYENPSFNITTGSFSGLVCVSDLSNGDMGSIAFVGTDDGKTFWNVYGKWTDRDDGELIGHFSHRQNGMVDTKGVASDTGITWTNAANATMKIPDLKTMAKPKFEITQGTFTQANQVGGFYKNGKTYVNGTFKGTRMIAANYYPDLTFIGTDDGTSFWTIIGRWDGPSGQFIADFAPIGGPNVTGKINHNSIEWSDSSFWAREAMKAGEMPQIVTV